MARTINAKPADAPEWATGTYTVKSTGQAGYDAATAQEMAAAAPSDLDTIEFRRWGSNRVVQRWADKRFTSVDDGAVMYPVSA